VTPNKNKMERQNLTTLARDGAKKSLWQSEIQRLDANEVASGQPFDAIIIGGGITGVTAALNLCREGKKCLLIEAENLGFGTTGGTSAHLNTFLDATYPEIDSDFGKHASKQMAEAAKKVIQDIKGNIETLGIEADFEYKDAYLFSQTQQESEQLQAILTSSREAGVTVSEVFDNGVPIAFERVLKFSNQAQFHPTRYIHGLAKEFLRLGGRILENTFVRETAFINGIHELKTHSGTFTGRYIIWATHIPPGINILSLRNAPYRSYVLAVKLKNNSYPESLCYDMQEPYHYIRSHKIKEQQYLIVGGEDHKTGHADPENAFSELEKYVREHFEAESIDYQWSSQYYVPVDGLPYIGQLPGSEKGIYVATGFNGNGMILGTLSANILTDIICENPNSFTQLLSPSRLKPISGFSEFIKENADVAYHFVADRFRAEAIRSIAELQPAEGKIVNFEGEKLAVYKDEKGKVTALSPVCTHAGCIIQWNAYEGSWDCPCHGGRFSVRGKVLCGPPVKDLQKIDIESLSDT